MVYLKKKRWLLLLKQLDFQPLRGDLAQGVLETLVQVVQVDRVVRLLNKMPPQEKLLKLR
tara:strand:- start:284 stop:463 length:180 start_codon:yes stop_codon:yes gene_type:complete